MPVAIVDCVCQCIRANGPRRIVKRGHILSTLSFRRNGVSCGGWTTTVAPRRMELPSGMRAAPGQALLGAHLCWRLYRQLPSGPSRACRRELPHNWITPSDGDEIIEKRDIVVQFDARKLESMRRDFPEAAELHGLFKRASLGVEFSGETAVECAARLEALGNSRGLQALAEFLGVLSRLANSRQYRLLSTEKFGEQFKPGSPFDVRGVEQALNYIQKNFRTGVSLSEVATLTGLSDSSFSRFFQSQTGNSFSEHLATIRVWSACKLLSDSEKPITDICFNSGFNNISNFNRTFVRRMKMTPSQYRSASGKRNLL